MAASTERPQGRKIGGIAGPVWQKYTPASTVLPNKDTDKYE